MTNLEKSREIAQSYEDDEISVEDIVIACMGMSKWKEEQMLNKACEWLSKCTILADATIQRFRKAMEE